jgi:glycerol-3-phosphate acyltransferase PlsY
MEDFGLILLGYLLGSIPTAYLAGRLLRRVDLRQWGSRTISATMVYYHVSRWALLPVGLLDVLKGAAPALLAMSLGRPRGVAVAAGLAAVLGHNWPLSLGFHGGRGIGPFLGWLGVLFPPGALWILGGLAIGRGLRLTAVTALLAIAALPGFVLLLNGPSEVAAGALGMLGITVVKRLEANREPLPVDPAERRRVLWRRLWLDRDVAFWEAWMFRRPGRP